LLLTLAFVAAPSPLPVPVASATPEIVATPASTSGLVLPPAPAMSPLVRIPEDALPSGDLVGTSGPFVGLSLGDAIAMALARNTDLGVAQSNRRIAGWQIVAAEGAYDLRLMVTPSFGYEQIPSLSPFQSGPGGGPAQQTTAGLNGQIDALTPGGGRFGIATSAQRIDNNNTINGYEPYYQTALSLMYTQPLGRGAGIDDARRQLQLAKINADLSNDSALLQASNTLGNVLDAYYDLISAWKNVAIQEEALLQAKAQSESNARLVKAGAAAAVDVIESDTQVNTFQDSVYSAIQNVGSLQNRLKGLILNNPADPIWNANLVPVNAVLDAPAEPRLDDLVVAALRARPEVGQLREQMRGADVNVRYAQEQTKPQIDLNLSAGENGFAGTATNPASNPFIASSNAELAAINQLIARVNANSPPGQAPLVPLVIAPSSVPSYTTGGLGQAYASMFGGRYPQITLSATIAFPLRNRTAEGNYHAALEQRSQLSIQEVALIGRIQSEARNALQTYRSARSRAIASAAARQAAEQVAASELRKFKAGSSTTFLVLQRQVELANQRGRELQAQTDVAKALVELDRVSGALLMRNGVDVTKIGSAPLGTTPALLR
jgi:HAE1 family hydrophobic/amphiphilic exporter-1